MNCRYKADAFSSFWEEIYGCWERRERLAPLRYRLLTSQQFSVWEIIPEIGEDVYEKQTIAKIN
jgi:hypothetical protein